MNFLRKSRLTDTENRLVFTNVEWGNKGVGEWEVQSVGVR